MTSVMNALAKATVVEVLPIDQRTADANSTGIDISNYEGPALLILKAKNLGGTTPTLDVKAQTSDESDFSSGVDDVVGGAFTQVTTGVAFQVLQLNMDGQKKHLRVVHDVGGTSPDYVAAVTLIARKKYAA